jgi:hypothetical protein
LASTAVELVVVTEAKKSEIALTVIGWVLIQVRNLALLFALISLESEADAASAS